ncbi:MAG: hypothetical protein ABIH74_05840 [Candidatus Omnitrophota bacterium]
MVLLVKVLSIVLIVYGCLIVLRPGIFKKILEYAKKKKERIYIASGAKAALGVLLVFASFKCRVSWIVLVMGGLMILGGIAGFLIKKEVVNKMLDWAEARSTRDMYMLGGAALAFGVLLALAA